MGDDTLCTNKRPARATDEGEDDLYANEAPAQDSEEDDVYANESPPQDLDEDSFYANELPVQGQDMEDEDDDVYANEVPTQGSMTDALPNVPAARGRAAARRASTMSTYSQATDGGIDGTDADSTYSKATDAGIARKKTARRSCTPSFPESPACSALSCKRVQLFWQAGRPFPASAHGRG